MSTTSKEFRVVENHPVDLTGGQVVAAGEFVELDAAEQKDPHNKALIDEGALLPVPKKES
jgi:hypothetical protein